MKILQLYYKMPFPLHDGGAVSVYSASNSLLKANAGLRILAMNQAKAPCSINDIPEDFRVKTRFDSVLVDNHVKPLQALRYFFSPDSYLAGRFNAEDFRLKLAEILQQEEFDVIQLEHLYLCHYVGEIRKLSKTKIVLRAQNVEHSVWSDYSSKLRNPFPRYYLKGEIAKLKKFEDQAISLVDGVIALTEQDAEYFRKIRGDEQVMAIPVGIDFLGLDKVDRELQYQDFPQVYHLGSMDWRPNVQGMHWFIDRVLPLVIKKMPGIKINIAGKNMPSFFLKRKSQNLFVEGMVEDAVKFQEDKAIMIVPLLSGSGIRVKILEGMAMGKTIISTSNGASGIPVVNNESILIADTPEKFAAQICRCAASISFCREIGLNAQKVALENYEIKKTGTQILDFYQQLISINHSA